MQEVLLVADPCKGKIRAAITLEAPYSTHYRTASGDDASDSVINCTNCLNDASADLPPVGPRSSKLTAAVFAAESKNACSHEVHEKPLKQ